MPRVLQGVEEEGASESFKTRAGLHCKPGAIILHANPEITLDIAFGAALSES